MARITALQANKRQVKLFLDGKFAFSLSSDIVSEKALHNDQVLTTDEIDSLVKRDRYQRCLNSANSYLRYRPRSISELRARLERRGFNCETQDSVLNDLIAEGLLDDTAFAQYWAYNRESFSPRSRRLTKIELQKKGVPNEVIEQALISIDDESSAYRAGSGHLRSMHWSNRDQFWRRLGGYLERRGFGYSVIKITLERIWKEIETENSVTGKTG